MKLKLFILLFLLQTGFLYAAEPFRFALLTDIHLSSDTTTVNDLKHSVNQINKSGGVDFVLVAGDITEYGDTVYLRQSKEILGNLNVPYYIVPGNHETKLLPNGLSDFTRVFGKDRFRFEHKGIYFLGFNTGAKKGEGHVDKKDLKWLKKRLGKIGKKSPVLLVTHYPIQKGDVDNWEKAINTIRPYNIRAILTGHYHRNAILSFGGIPGIVNRSNLRAKQAAGGYTLYETTKDSMIIYEQPIGKEKFQWGAFSLETKYD